MPNVKAQMPKTEAVKFRRGVSNDCFYRFTIL